MGLWATKGSEQGHQTCSPVTKERTFVNLIIKQPTSDHIHSLGDLGSPILKQLQSVFPSRKEETKYRFAFSQISAVEENGYPLQYSYLENFIDRGAWRATFMGSQSQTQLSD